MMRMTRICEILNEFKDSCQRRGWRTSESDWVGTDEGYHTFLWARSVPLSSFKRIVSNGKCVLSEGLSYRVVKASYTAWLFCETPSEAMIQTVLENPDFSSRIAIFDISPLIEGRNLCLRLNNTDSPVFREFESFLRRDLGVKVQSVPSSEEVADTYTISEPA